LPRRARCACCMDEDCIKVGLTIIPARQQRRAFRERLIIAAGGDASA
jgi:hypothetical protein